VSAAKVKDGAIFRFADAERRAQKQSAHLCAKTAAAAVKLKRAGGRFFALCRGAIEREKCEKMRALRVRVRWGKGQSAGLPTCIGNCLCTAARSRDKSITELSRSIFFFSEEAFYI
jgi:hypothetical protein